MKSAALIVIIATIAMACTQESEPTALSAEQIIEAQIADQFARLQENTRKLLEFRQRLDTTLPNLRAESDPQLAELLQQIADQDLRLAEHLDRLRAEMRDRLGVQLPDNPSIPGNWHPFTFMGRTYYFVPLAM